MEPFRVLVDREVCKQRFVKFENEEKLTLVRMMSERILIDGKNNTISNTIRIYTKSVFDAISDRDVAQLRFYRYEL